MSHTCYTGPPMTLGNMRQNGVRHLDVSCWQCQHGALLDVEGYADDASPVVRTLPRQRTSLWPAAMSALGPQAEVSRFFALKDATGVNAGLPYSVRDIGAKVHRTAPAASRL